MRNIRAAMGGGGGEGATVAPAAGNCGANHRQREGGREVLRWERCAQEVQPTAMHAGGKTERNALEMIEIP